MTPISKHFSLEELCRSDVAARNGIDMSPPVEVVANLTHWAREMGDPLRDHCGCPLFVTSGYRPVALNQLVGGSVHSDHLTGLAVDLHAPGHDLDWLVARARELPQLPILQAIVEFSSWLHISIDLGSNPKREWLSATRKEGRVVYAAV